MIKKIILLAGPTASGKSKLAIKLAKKLNGEIINADRMQIYKEFSILSSRPTQLEEKKVVHHLYGFTSVKNNFSVGEWFSLAKKKIFKCHKNNKTPILVGGTGLYFNTITKGLSKIPNIDYQVRVKARKLFNHLGAENFYKRLLEIDPRVRDKLLPSDSQRTQRAYEVFIQTKKSLFDWIKNTKSDFKDYEIKKIFLNIPRDILLKKISLRTELMFQNECIEEVKKFNLIKIKSSHSANKMIGIREINAYLKKSISLENCKALINVKTRQYAKRQNTWARGHMANWDKVYTKDFTILLKKVLKLVT